MTYTGTYASADLDDLFIDLIGMIVAVIIDNAVLVVTLVILGIVAVAGGKVIRNSLGLVSKIR